MIPLRLEEIARMSGGEVAAGGGAASCAGVSTDSRSVRAGDLFVAIRGERFDGHAFVSDVLARGAHCAMVDRQFAETAQVDRSRLIIVRDSIDALGRLAASYRRERLPASCRVIAITGSNGKTTTKRMLHHALAGSLRGVASPKSFNNHIGVPLTLLSAGADDEYVIAELGTNARGEIQALAHMTAPDLAVVTSVSEAHLEGLGSLRGVAEEKLSLIDGLVEGGAALVCVERDAAAAALARRGDDRVATFGRRDDTDLRISGALSDGAGVSFDLAGAIRLQRIRVPVVGTHHALNAAAAIWTAERLGVRPEAARDRLASFAAEPGRGARRQTGGVTIIDDTYNANPESMRGAIRALTGIPARRRVFVMGDMGELGGQSAQLHAECLAFAAGSGIDIVVAAGPQAAAAASAPGRTAAAGGCEVWAECAPGPLAARLDAALSDGDAVWFKASRAMALERIVATLDELLRQRDGGEDRSARTSSTREIPTAPLPANP